MPHVTTSAVSKESRPLLPALKRSRLDLITKDDVEALRFNWPAPSSNCALRTLRRMLHKAEEWNLVVKVPKFKLRTEQGRQLRLEEEAERRLLIAAEACKWKPKVLELLRDIIIPARDTGMRNGGSFTEYVWGTSIGITGWSSCRTARRLRAGG
jgi:hypothetical protein